MNRVYIIVRGGMDGGQVYAVFSTEHKAKSFCRSLNKSRESKRRAEAKKYNYTYTPIQNEFLIEIWDVDKTADEGVID
jgi:hypothetical protein